MKRKAKRIDPRLAKVVLAELKKAGPLRRYELDDRITATRSSFDTILFWLKKQGHVEKTSTKHTAPYQITEKGKRLLGGLQNVKCSS